jgi:phage baseplate assembly protein W
MADIQFPRVREYRDVSLTFARHPVTGDVVAVTGAEAVKRSIKTLLHTQAGEVPFFPNFGSALHQLLFEPVDAITLTSIDDTIRTTIDAFEPRASITDLNIVPRPDDVGYDVFLTIRLVNLPDPITLTVFLKRLR